MSKKSEVKIEMKEDVKTEATKTELKTDVQLDTQDIKKQLEELQKEIHKLQAEKRSFSNAEKAAIEEARDEMLTDDEVGTLFIDDKYKEDGYFYRIVDTTRPGRVASHIKRGYEVVQDPDLKVGDNTVSKTSNLSSAVMIELGMNKACPGVLMRIPTDLYKKRQEAKARAIKESERAMAQDAVNKSQFGEITIGEATYKK
jgi:hypothetical protein